MEVTARLLNKVCTPTLLALFDHVLTKHRRVSLIGRSLGSGTVTYLRCQRGVDRMVLITPYGSVENVLMPRIPFYPISIMLKDKYDSAEKTARVLDSFLESQVMMLNVKDKPLQAFFSGS